MTSRSHPPTLLRLAETSIVRENLIEPEQKILCAVSGGPDSTALLHVLVKLRDNLGHTVVAAGVDHGLRANAQAELAVARENCERLGVAFHLIALDVGHGANLQERARRARHASLQSQAENVRASAIALGHTADDKAETVIMRLLRGAGPKGLAVMPAASPGIEGSTRLIRPLIAARRDDVLAHLERHDLSFCIDPSNQDKRFLRVRVRHELLPLMEDLSPGIVTHLCSLADMLKPGRDALAGFGRAQRELVERTLRDGAKGLSRAVTVRLRGGRELSLRFGKGESRSKKRRG